MWFGTLLLVLFVVTGICWLLDKFYFAPARRRAADHIIQQAKAQGIGGYQDAAQAVLARPAFFF